jgi:hypothetical protein
MATKKYKCRQVKMDLKREQLGSRVYEDDESDMQEFKQNPC